VTREGTPFRPSIIKVSITEMGELLIGMNKMLDDIRGFYKGDLSLKNKLAAIGAFDHTQEEFWDDSITTKLKSGQLEFRPTYSPRNGKIGIRLMSRRPKKEGYTNNWLGVTMFLLPEECVDFLNAFRKIGKEIRSLELVRFGSALGSVQF